MAAVRRNAWASELSEAALGGDEAFRRIEPVISAFLSDARECSSRRTAFLGRPVEVPAALPPDKALTQILDALTAGKNPFGLLAFGNKAHQAAFEAIRIAGRAPGSASDWQHVRGYVEYHGMIVNLAARWRTLRSELSVPDTVGFGRSLSMRSTVLQIRSMPRLVVIPDGLRESHAQLSHALGSHEERPPSSGKRHQSQFSRMRFPVMWLPSASKV